LSEPKAKIDPELVRQLDAAQAAGQKADGSDHVQAVVYLRPTSPDQPAVPPDRMQGMVEDLLGRVAKEVGESSRQHNTFRNLGSFAVAAAPEFIRELLRQPEVAAAVANRKG